MDPLAEIAYDWTPYKYCYNDPVNYIDPFGLTEEPTTTKRLNIFERFKNWVSNKGDNNTRNKSLVQHKVPDGTKKDKKPDAPQGGPPAEKGTYGGEKRNGTGDFGNETFTWNGSTWNDKDGVGYLGDVNIMSNENRDPYDGVGGVLEYIWTGGIENGNVYDGDGNRMGPAPKMGLPPDIGVGKLRGLTHLHHAWPKFLGGLNKNNLVRISVKAHKALHKEMNAFLSRYGMSPSRANPGRKIRQNYSNEEIKQALTDFYTGAGAKYKEVAEQFFKYIDGF